MPTDSDDTLESLRSPASDSAPALMYNNTLGFFYFFSQDSNLLMQNNLLQLPPVNVIKAASH